MSGTEPLPFVIDVTVKNIADARNVIYAFNTKVSLDDSIKEIKDLIIKLGGKGFQYTEHPRTGAQYIRFMYVDKNIGDVSMHIDIPQIYLKTDRTSRHLLEKVGIRLAILELKVKLYKLCGKVDNPLSIFVENILTRSGLPISQYLSTGKNVAGLLPESTG